MSRSEQKPKEKVYWTTKDGREIDVDEMDIQHLRNTLKMIIRQRDEPKEGDDSLGYLRLLDWSDFESWC